MSFHVSGSRLKRLVRASVWPLLSCCASPPVPPVFSRSMYTAFRAASWSFRATRLCRAVSTAPPPPNTPLRCEGAIFHVEERGLFGLRGLFIAGYVPAPDPLLLPSLFATDSGSSPPLSFSLPSLPSPPPLDSVNTVSPRLAANTASAMRLTPNRPAPPVLARCGASLIVTFAIFLSDRLIDARARLSLRVFKLSDARQSSSSTFCWAAAAAFTGVAMATHRGPFRFNSRKVRTTSQFNEQWTDSKLHGTSLYLAAMSSFGPPSMRPRGKSRVMKDELMEKLKNKLRAASYVYGKRDTKKLFGQYTDMAADGDGLDYDQLHRCLIKLVAGITTDEITQLFYSIGNGAPFITAE